MVIIEWSWQSNYYSVLVCLSVCDVFDGWRSQMRNCYKMADRALKCSAQLRSPKKSIHQVKKNAKWKCENWTLNQFCARFSWTWSIYMQPCPITKWPIKGPASISSEAYIRPLQSGFQIGFVYVCLPHFVLDSSLKFIIVAGYERPSTPSPAKHISGLPSRVDFKLTFRLQFPLSLVGHFFHSIWYLRSRWTLSNLQNKKYLSHFSGL